MPPRQVPYKLLPALGLRVVDVLVDSLVADTGPSNVLPYLALDNLGRPLKGKLIPDSLEIPVVGNGLLSVVGRTGLEPVTP